MRGWLFIAGLLVWLAQAPVMAFDQFDFDTPEKESLFKELAAELRCLVCQNQNIADSNAELAQDLRREIAQLITDGDGKSEIIDFMVARYGEFVLYKPRINASTVALWLGPLVFFLLGLWTVVRLVRGGNVAADIDEDALAQARKLLDSSASKTRDNG